MTRYARFVLVLCLASSVALTATSGHHTRTNGSVPALPASVVVRARSPIELPSIERFAAARGFRVLHRAPELSALRFALPRGVSFPAGMSALWRAPAVVYVEPSHGMTASDVPADPLYERQRSYLDPVHAPEAWDIETGRPEVVVAILDTGLDVTHPDLQGRVWTNAREIPGNGIDDDGNECVDDVHGCAFVSTPDEGCRDAAGGDVSDDSGHGTFVAGVIAANADGAGMVGVARGVTVMPVKVLDCGGGGNSIELAQGILYAAKNGARVLNISLGGATDPLIVREAVRIATSEYGALVVAASGNNGGDGVAYPARYPEVLAVGAASIDDPGSRAPFSAAGPEVDVAAIGQGVIGTVPSGMCTLFAVCISGLHAAGDGTSFAAPQVAGLAALLLSRRAGMTPAALIAQIKAAADPVTDPGEWAGAGRVNMLRALELPYRLGVPGAARD